MSDPRRYERVGIVGVGRMGSAMVGHLVRAGFEVVGTDVAPGARERLADLGGHVLDSAREVGAVADRVITSLPSDAALDEVVSGSDGLLAAEAPLAIIETSTLAIQVKRRLSEAATARGSDLIDCPLSGTGSQAEQGDVVVYASGVRGVIDRCMPIFDGFARATHVLGELGTGSAMKFIANHLVLVHTAAAAEMFVLGGRAGLAPATVLEVMRAGAGASRMMDVRGPLMVAGDYPVVGVEAHVFMKDIHLIADHAATVGCPIILFAINAQFVRAVVAQNGAGKDIAAICEVMERHAGNPRGDRP